MSANKAYKQLLLGMLSLFIVMAIGRFSYTPILPFMQKATHLTNENAGLLATVNYLGYLIGAMIPTFLIIKSKVVDLKIYLLINIISVLLMGVTQGFLVWNILRFIAGITSGTVFVLASNVVLESLNKGGKSHLSGFLYSGVGIGIFTSSIFIQIYTDYNTWASTWIILGIASLVLGFIVIFFMKEIKEPVNLKQKTIHINDQNSTLYTKWFMVCFSIAYLLEGAGYIVTGTFLVAIVESIPDLKEYAALSWMFVGMAAIPSCVLWSILGNKIGFIKAIYLAFILQIIGVILPVFSHNIISLVISSCLFGGTFLGLTTLFMSRGQLMSAVSGRNLVALLTFIYSLGQVVAPYFAGILIGSSNNYNGALIFASSLLILALVAIFMSIRPYRPKS
ncbi:MULTISPECIES: YbfB/YjiJ family MFS transporter [Mammaliicoccus]|uniref:YbfB/YjiJ family MFS transporter n=1 Tax=Mammaliicoccus sciuri TaxID=1296 RepID=A0ABT7HYB5_MAMSC|nr:MULTISPECIES: YbfB/YjiJ family MFS transporter [Mammaliicoccus]MCJ0915263.1 YbfB/YjiJ family MFS transporter [Mammaliicoccus sciuri]MCJ1781231.1 YbfB/YjiJ family MFS transporter [Mammaliicoccus sciuri]MCJ1783839.1 YbfB/YjiJ family MFS transporter [Mammaliicoccus sciuri]MDL0111954.1 YbfB/YjiJ family MFS transporter [Mammaliicoccus sciuri]MDL0117040.1 YbfB/YjiJ family MFS transporter [Mammaliicoccus sciuri]